MSDILSPEDVARLDAFYDTTLAPKLDAIDDWRRQVRWLVIKSLIIVLPAIVLLFAGDLLDAILPFEFGPGTLIVAGIWLVAGLIFIGVKYVLPGVTAYANYKTRFKQDIVGEVFKVVCPSAVYEPLQGITAEVFDAPGLFNWRGSFQSDDRVRGRMGQTPFEMSEVSRAYSTGTGKHARTYEVFRGLFFHFDSPRRLGGVTLIEPAEAREHQRGTREGLGLLALDDASFDAEFKVHASSEPEACELLTPSMMTHLLTLRRLAGQPVFLAFKDRRAYVAVHYGRALFEPGIARSTSKAVVRGIAEQFALVETIVRELDLDRPRQTTEVVADQGDAVLQGAGVEPHALSRLAAEKAGTLTPSDVWTMAIASVDDSAADADAPAPMPPGTRIRVDHGPGVLSITYGLRVGFWVLLALSLGGALLASSALRAEDAPAWAAPASGWLRTLPPVPGLGAFAADAPTPWLIVGTVVAVLFGFGWTGYVRRVCIDHDRIRIYRGFRPFPRTYRRPLYGRVIRLNTILYIAKSDGVGLSNPTASPALTEAEARWLSAEMTRTLRQGA